MVQLIQANNPFQVQNQTFKMRVRPLTLTLNTCEKDLTMLYFTEVSGTMFVDKHTQNNSTLI